MGSIAAGAEKNMLISGYGNTHYMDHDGAPNLVGERDLNDGFFQLREFSLFLDFPINDWILASTELEAGDNGNQYSANYAYVEIQPLDNLSFRVGKILVPFLSYNENKPNFKQNLMSQPFTAFNVAPVIGVPILFHGFGWSESGVMGHWNNFVGDIGIVDLKLAVINGLGSDSNVLDDNTVQLNAGMMMPHIRPRDGLLQNEETNGLRDNNDDKATVLKLTFKPMDFPVDFGFSWYRGAWDPSGDRDLSMYGGHLNYLEENWTLKGEYVLAEVEQTAGFDPVAAAGLTPNNPAINTTTGDYHMKAWYAEASFIPFRYGRGKNRFFRLVFRYYDVDTNDKASFTPWDRSRITAGMEWQFAPNTRFRYEWQRHEIDDFQNAPAPYRNAGGEEIIEMNMASVIFSF
jgi:hypothetical protein